METGRPSIDPSALPVAEGVTPGTTTDSLDLTTPTVVTVETPVAPAAVATPSKEAAPFTKEGHQKLVDSADEFLTNGLTNVGKVIGKGLRVAMRGGLHVGIGAAEVSAAAVVIPAVAVGMAAVETGRFISESTKKGIERLSAAGTRALERGREISAKLREKSAQALEEFKDSTAETALVLGSVAADGGAWLAKVAESSIKPASEVFASAAAVDAAFFEGIEGVYSNSSDRSGRISDSIYKGVAGVAGFLDRGIDGARMDKRRKNMGKFARERVEKISSKLEGTGWLGKIVTRGFNTTLEVAARYADQSSELNETRQNLQKKKEVSKSRAANYKSFVSRIASSVGSQKLTDVANNLYSRAEAIAAKYDRGVMEDNK